MRGIIHHVLNLEHSSPTCSEAWRQRKSRDPRHLGKDAVLVLERRTSDSPPSSQEDARLAAQPKRRVLMDLVLPGSTPTTIIPPLRALVPVLEEWIRQGEIEGLMNAGSSQSRSTVQLLHAVDLH